MAENGQKYTHLPAPVISVAGVYASLWEQICFNKKQCYLSYARPFFNYRKHCYIQLAHFYTILM